MAQTRQEERSFIFFQDYCVLILLFSRYKYEQANECWKISINVWDRFLQNPVEYSTIAYHQEIQAFFYTHVCFQGLNIFLVFDKKIGIPLWTLKISYWIKLNLSFKCGLSLYCSWSLPLTWYNNGGISNLDNIIYL